MGTENTQESGNEKPSTLKKLIIPTSFRKSLSSTDVKTVLSSENRNVLLVAATLIAAATFQAGVNPPGGVWQQDYVPPPSPSPSPPPKAGESSTICTDYSAGQSIYSCHPVSFHVFLISNTLAFTSSISLLLCLTFGYPFFLEVCIASVSMVITYASSIYEITPYETAHFRLVFISSFGTLLLRSFISLVANVIRKILNRDPDETPPANSTSP